MRGMRGIVLTALTVLCASIAGSEVAHRVPATSVVASAGAIPPAPVIPSVTVPPVSAMRLLAGPAAPADLEVMSFNLRYASITPPHSWAERRPVTRALLAAERPDLIGTQEGLAIQLRDIESDLGADYDRIGHGRDPGGLGEHMEIFFNRTRLTPQRYGHFWLSETPEVPGSISWDAHRVRMVTWVLFADRETGARFYAVNTHLDNVSETARRRSARLIMDRIAAFGPVPIVLTGDFNSPATPDGEVYRLLTAEAGLRDSWSAPRRGPAWGTIHNYEPLIPDGQRVDWILTSPGITVLAALINTHRQAGQFPSDHLPVQARLRLPS
ncbi:endonuclease/exonuclease/phosphatase family protein [Actinoplanes xinjiangensis]|uniref:endonuclease/exonuclease/phosphatase family protein n=1 Tax=Actinoplanes xinjiangensis TaxID=512350 RepID=UPI003446931B